jgi:hypothetical protein
MKPIPRSLLAVPGAVLLFCCSNNPGTNGGRTLNVNGTVMKQTGGASANVPVVIKSGAAFLVSTATDSSGNFAVANIPTPYDAMVLIGNRVTVSVGLTSATPTVLDMFSTPSLTGNGGYATLSGTVSGGIIGVPMAGPSMTQVLFASPEVQTNQYLAANPETGAYSTNDAYTDGPFNWSGPTTTTGTLHVLQSLEQVGYDPISYSGYGFKENVSLATGSAVTGEDIALTAVTTATLAGTYNTPPAGYIGEDALVALKFGSGGLMVIEDDVAPSETFSYNSPNIPGATLVLVALAGKEGSDAYSLVVDTGLAVDASGVTVSFPAVEEGLLTTQTIFTTGTQFPLTAVPNAVHLVVIGSGASEYSSTVPSYIFLTSGTSVTIPDLTFAGLRLPASTDYTWVVYGLGPYADVEAASAGLCGEHQWGYLNSFNYSPFNINLVNSSTGGFVTASPTGHFTTAPMSTPDDARSDIR